MLVDTNTALLTGLHRQNANRGEKFEESHTGLDHILFQVADRAALKARIGRLDELNIGHTGIRRRPNGPYATVVLRDPDNKQLEFVAPMPTGAERQSAGACPARASGTPGLVEAENRQARFNASQLDVVAPALFPALPGEFPYGERRGVASPGSPGSAVRFIAQCPGHGVRCLVVSERLAGGFTGVQAAEGEVEYRRAHLGAQATAAE